MKVTKSISIDSEFIPYMEQRRINLSRWVNQKMKEEFKSKAVRIEEIEKEIVEKQKIIVEINNEDAKKAERLREKIEGLSKEAKLEIIESLRILEQQPNLFEGRLNRYRHLFDNTLTVDEFKVLLNNIKK